MKTLLFVSMILFAGAAWSQDGSMMKKVEPSPGANGSMMKADSAMTDKSVFDIRGLGKQVIPFTTEVSAQQLAKTQTVVFYFAATWCPTCQTFYRDLKVNFVSIPGSVTLIYVNYDKAAELKKKYGVTSQHTFVSIDAGGQKKKVWNGNFTVSEFLKVAGQP